MELGHTTLAASADRRGAKEFGREIVNEALQSSPQKNDRWHHNISGINFLQCQS